jgi:hypothetical protein
LPLATPWTQGTVVLFHSLVTLRLRDVSLQQHTLGALPLAKELPVPLGGHQSRSGRFGELSLASTGFRTPDHPASTVPARHYYCYYVQCKDGPSCTVRLGTSLVLQDSPDPELPLVCRRCVTVACAKEIREVCRHMRDVALATVARTCCDIPMTSSDAAWVRVCTISVADLVDTCSECKETWVVL